MGSLHVLEHPLIQHKLYHLRNKNTGVKEFRELVGEIAALMCYEATRNLPTKEVEVETPIGRATVRSLAGKKLAIVPILRAGLGMVDAMIDMIPSVLMQKGPLINNAWLYANEERRRTMNKKPYYIQSGIVFLLIGAAFGLIGMFCVTKEKAFLYAEYAVMGIVLVRARGNSN